MCSRKLYPGDRVVCFGEIADVRRDTAAAYGKDIPPAGHVVVRVAPGGGAFRVMTLSARDESMTVLYESSFVSHEIV